MAIFLEDTIDFSQYLRETDHMTFVKPASIWMDGLIDKLQNPDKTKRVYLPWEKTRDLFNFRSGEVTLWAGQNGHGKSLVTTQLALSLMGQDERVVLASFEMKPHTTLQRMARMYCCENPFSPAFQGEDGIKLLTGLYQEFGEWSDKRLWIYDQQGTVSADKVIGMARYCAKELGITHVFIDSLMKCVKGEDDYNGQKELVDELCSLARDNNIHIHLIHHLRKPASEMAMPDKHDTKGSGSITDQVDNVMMVWRNKAKEEDHRVKGGLSNKRTEHDAAIFCRKQRNGDDEPTITLWFDRESQQYLESDTARPMFFPNNFPHRAS